MPDEYEYADERDDFESADRSVLSRILREHGSDTIVEWMVADLAERLVEDDGFSEAGAIAAARKLLGVKVFE